MQRKQARQNGGEGPDGLRRGLPSSQPSEEDQAGIGGDGRGLVDGPAGDEACSQGQRDHQAAALAVAAGSGGRATHLRRGPLIRIGTSD